MIMTAAKRRFSLWESILVLYCLSLEVDVNAVSSCINRIELLERLIPPERGMYITATSYIPPYSPSEARTSGIGWCSDDPTSNNAEKQYIEVDFGAEVIIEAVAILIGGRGYITHYSVEYAGLDKDFNCIWERISNDPVLNGNRIRSLNLKTYNFTNPVTARYVRIIPVQWVGTSACLRMELFGCTVKECQTMHIIQPDAIDMSSDQALSYWCALVPEPQLVTLRYYQLVYLTQIQVRSNSVTFSIYQHANHTLYENIMGLDSYTIPSNMLVTALLWPPINTAQLEFHLYPENTLDLVCFAVELTGCLFSNVVDHTEDSTASSTLTDNIGTCLSVEPLTSSTSSYSDCTCDDNCNIVAIAVPTALVVIALIVIICVNIVVVKMMNKRRKDTTPTTNNCTTCVVENDLYQLSQEPAKETTNDGNVSQYSVVDQPNHDSPVAAIEDGVPVYSKIEDGRQYEDLTQPPMDGNSRPLEYEVVVDANLVEKTDAYYSVPITSTPPMVPNPSYEKSHEILHDTDEQ